MVLQGGLNIREKYNFSYSCQWDVSNKNGGQLLFVKVPHQHKPLNSTPVGFWIKCQK